LAWRNPSFGLPYVPPFRRCEPQCGRQRIKQPCAAPQRSGLSTWRRQLAKSAKPRSVRAGPIVARTPLADASAEWPTGASGSPLFGFLSLQRLPTGPRFGPEVANLQAIPLRRSIRPCGLLSRSSSQAPPMAGLATAGRFGHASPASFSATFRYLCGGHRSGRSDGLPFLVLAHFGSDNTPGILALRSFNPA